MSRPAPKRAVGSAAPTILINAAIDKVSGSGVERALTSLATGLSSLTDGRERYLYLTSPLAPHWIQADLTSSARVVVAPMSIAHGHGARTARLRRFLGRLAGPAAQIARRTERVLATRALNGEQASQQTLATFIVGLRPDVVHFPFQQFVRTGLPSIFEPWDLQHLHLPEFFTAEDQERRRRLYEPACREAAAVVVGSNWVRRDLIRRFGISPSKVYVIRRAPPLDLLNVAASNVREVRARYRLPPSFALYPAQTWPHKNHVGLIDSVALLCETGRDVTVVCTGALTDHVDSIRAQLRERRLEEHVRLVGYVPVADLRAMFSMARCLIIPSLFEGYGLPLLEAFALGVPVAAADVTCLPEVAGGAALLFDPRSPVDTADALGRVWSDDGLRAMLVERGRERLRAFDRTTAARTFRALYRSLAELEVSATDADLLNTALADHPVQGRPPA